MKGLVLLATPLLAAAAPPVPLSRAFGAWLVACDNVRTCEIGAAGPDARSALDIIRGAGQARPLVTFRWAETQSPGHIEIDGQPAPIATQTWMSDYNGFTLATYDRPATASLIAALRSGRQLTLGTVPARPRHPAVPEPEPIPLAGLEDAVRLVDEVQSRDDTPDPLAPGATRVGNHAPPPPPPLPVSPPWHLPPPLTTVDAGRLIAQARHDPAVQLARTTLGCTVDTGDTAQALDRIHALVLQPCTATEGRSAAIATILPRAGGPAALVDTSTPFSHPSPSDKLGLVSAASFDRKTGQLSLSDKARALGDCGRAVTWVWDGAAFRLDKLAAKDVCGAVGAGDFPVLYRTTTTPARY